MGYIIDENVILSLDPKHYIDLGSIVNQVFRSHRELYYKHFEKLSEDATQRLMEIEQEFYDYNVVISKVNLFYTLENIFPSMTANHLSHFIKAIEDLIPVFPEYFIHNPQDSGKIVKTIVQLIPRLVQSSLRHPDTELNMGRLVFLIGLIKLILTGTLIQTTSESFAQVLLFYNMILAKNADSHEFEGIHEDIASILNQIVEKNNFFKTIPQRGILYKYYKTLSPGKAEEMMNLILLHNLELNSSGSSVFAENISTGKSLGINVSSYLVNFIVKEFEEYFTNHSHAVNLDVYKGGKIIVMARMLLQNTLVSKTEGTILEWIIQKYSS